MGKFEFYDGRKFLLACVCPFTMIFIMQDKTHINIVLLKTHVPISDIHYYKFVNVKAEINYCDISLYLPSCFLYLILYCHIRKPYKNYIPEDIITSTIAAIIKNRFLENRKTIYIFYCFGKNILVLWLKHSVTIYCPIIFIFFLELLKKNKL